LLYAENRKQSAFFLKKWHILVVRMPCRIGMKQKSLQNESKTFIAMHAG